MLRLVAAGLSNAEIANRLRISPATAKTHVAHLLTKLDARDRVQLVIIAFQAGLTAASAARRALAVGGRRAERTRGCAHGFVRG